MNIIVIIIESFKIILIVNKNNSQLTVNFHISVHDKTFE